MAARSAAVTGRLLPYGWSGDPHVTGPESWAAPTGGALGTEDDCARPCAKNKTQAVPVIRTEHPDLSESMSLLTFALAMAYFMGSGSVVRASFLDQAWELKPSVCYVVVVLGKRISAQWRLVHRSAPKTNGEGFAYVWLQNYGRM